jgi:dipeptidyl-peptidase-4
MLRSFALLLLVAAPLAAAEPAPLTVDRIFASDEFKGDRVPSVKWLDGGAYLSTQPSKAHKGATDIILVDAAGKSEVLVPAEKLIPTNAKEPLAVQGFEFNKDRDLVLIHTNSVRVWRANTRGDYWTFRRSTGALAKLGGGDAKPSTLQFAKLAPDGTKVGYVRGNNLYVEPAEGGPAVKLTTDGTDEIINGTFDWVYEEEFFCRDGWRWSPDGKRIAFWQLDTRGVPTFTIIDNTSGKYPALKTFAYPKTGERNSQCRVGVVSATGGSTTWMAVPGDTKNDFYIPRMEWAGNADELVITRINRLQNAVDVMFANAADGTVKIALTERDNAWLDIHDDALEFLDGGKEFTWISERDGWRHLYAVSRDGTKTRRITSGKFDVIKVLRVDEKKGVAWFTSALGGFEGAIEQNLFSVPLAGGEAEARTFAMESSWHDYQIAKDGTHAVHTFSRFGEPPIVEIITLPDHKSIRVLAGNEKLREAIVKLNLPPVEFIRADIGNGVKLDGWIIKPKSIDGTAKVPLLIHVYGEPAGQTVTNRWGGNNYLWHAMLAQQGYAVASFDNRGTHAPRGREWRKSVYRKIGVLASEDQAAATRDLLARYPSLDSSRVGVWGWSGGGSMTLNLLFRHPELYSMGMAVAPVPDMSLYDTIYQERYMGLPQDNAEDYRLGSPITHAAGLKGKLLLVHGTGDDNVHYQGTEKLVEKLIELNKPFSLMAYPNRSHSINEGMGTSRHLYSLLTRYLNENMPLKP